MADGRVRGAEPLCTPARMEAEQGPLPPGEGARPGSAPDPAPAEGIQTREPEAGNCDLGQGWVLFVTGD